MLDPIFINRKESARILGIGVDKFDRDVRPHIQTIEWGGKILFKLEEIKGFAEYVAGKPKPLIQVTRPTSDREGNVIRPCDEETAKLKKTYKGLPKGSQARLDKLLLRLRGVSDKAHGRNKG